MRSLTSNVFGVPFRNPTTKYVAVDVGIAENRYSPVTLSDNSMPMNVTVSSPLSRKQYTVTFPSTSVEMSRYVMPAR